MELKTYTDYALRVLLYVGMHRGQSVTMREIAQSYSISQEHLRKVVHHLAKEHYLLTKRGKTGGIQLARSPDSIFIGEVVEMMEGTMHIIDCALKDAVNSAKLAFIQHLNGYTLATLLGSKPLQERIKAIEIKV